MKLLQRVGRIHSCHGSPVVAIGILSSKLSQEPRAKSQEPRGLSCLVSYLVREARPKKGKGKNTGPVSVLSTSDVSYTLQRCFHSHNGWG